MFPSVVAATHTHTVCYGQDEVASYLYPTLGMQLPAVIQSPLFLSTWGAVMLEKKQQKKSNLGVSGRVALEMY